VTADFRDDPDYLSHSIALTAWVMVAAETGQVPPAPERTRLLAYQMYEPELAAEVEGKSRPQGTDARRRTFMEPLRRPPHP
jgi:hypothetical protein